MANKKINLIAWASKAAASKKTNKKSNSANKKTAKKTSAAQDIGNAAKKAKSAAAKANKQAYQKTEASRAKKYVQSAASTVQKTAEETKKIKVNTQKTNNTQKKNTQKTNNTQKKNTQKTNNTQKTTGNEKTKAARERGAVVLSVDRFEEQRKQAAAESRLNLLRALNIKRNNEKEYQSKKQNKYAAAIEEGQNKNALGTRVREREKEYDTGRGAARELLKGAQTAAIAGEGVRQVAEERKALKAQGVSDEELNDKEVQKNINKAIQSAVDEENRKLDEAMPSKVRYSYKDLTQQEYNRLATAAQTGQLDTLLKSDKDLAKKVADLNVRDYVKSAGTMGALDQLTQGLSVSQNPVYNYSDTQKQIIEKQKETRAYNVGRMAGAVGEFALGGTGTLGSALAKTGGKAALKEAAKSGGKNLAKTVGKNVAKETAGDAFASLPLNALDALKASYKDGKFDKKEFVKELALNVGGDIVIGGAVSGITHGLSGVQVKNFNRINKTLQSGGKVSDTELKFYNRHVDELADKLQTAVMKQADVETSGLSDEDVALYGKLQKKQNAGATLTADEKNAMARLQAKAQAENRIASSTKSAADNAAEVKTEEPETIFNDIAKLKQEKVRAEAIIDNSKNADEIATAITRLEEVNAKLDSYKAKRTSALTKSEAQQYLKLEARRRAGATLTKAEKKTLDNIVAKAKADVVKKAEDTAVAEVRKKYSVNEKALQAYKSADPKAIGTDGVTSSYVKPEDVPNNLRQTYSDFINSVDVKIKTAVQNLREGRPAGKKSFDVATVGESEVKFIKEKFGLDVSDYKHTIEADRLLHIDNDHGIVGASNTTMANANDVARIGYAIKNADSIEVSTDGNAASRFRQQYRDGKGNYAPIIIYKKRINGDMIVVEAVPDSAAKELRVVTAYFDTIKKDNPQVSDVFTPDITSRNDAGLMPSNNNISNSTENVNIKELEKEKAALLNEEKRLRWAQYHGKTPEHLLERHKRLTEIQSRVSEIDEAIAIKNPETDADWKVLGEHAEEQTYKDLAKNPVEATEGTWDKEVARVTGRKSKQTKLESPLGKVWRGFVDDFHAFEHFAKTLQGAERSEFMSLINNLRLSENRAGAWITEARTNLNREVIGKSLKDILDDYTLKRNADKYAQFNDYLYHKHNVARAQQGKPVFGDGITAEDSQKVIAEMESKYPEFIEKQSEIVQYFRDLQQVRVDAGLISLDAAKAFDDMYENYVPTYRVQDGQAFNAMHAKYSVKNGVNVATGSNKDLLFIHEQAAMVTEKTFKDVEANQLLKAYAKFGGFSVEDIKVKGVNPEEIVQAGTYLDNGDGTPTVRFWENGEAKRVEITNEMYEGLKTWSGLDKSDVMNWKLTKATGKLNRAFKHLITDWNPLFAITNGAKDFQDALFYSKDTAKFIASLPKAIRAIKNKDEYYKLYVANGGKYSSLFDVATNFKADSIIDKANPLKWIETLNSTIEIMPRMSEFIATVDKGVGKETLKLGGMEAVSKAGKRIVDEAMYNANDITLNFGRSGKYSRMMNQTLVPYFNPSIQGFDKLMRTFSENGFKGAAKMGIKASGLFVPPLILNEVMNHDVEGYADLNSRDKDMYYLIPLGDQRWIKIPKSRTGSTMTSPIQHFLNRSLYGTPYEADMLFKLMISNSAPIDPINSNLLSPLFNAKNNKTWWGGEIEYSSDEELPVNERYDENTSQISIWLGQTKTAQELGLSPKKINTIIDGYTGVIGDFVLPWTANAAKASPLKSKFVLDGIFSNRLSSDFWDKNSELRMSSKSRNATEKDMEKYSKFGAKYSYDAANMTQAIADIQNSDMSKKEKREKIRAIRRELNKIYKAGKSGEEHSIDPVNVIGKEIGFHKALANYSDLKGKEAYAEYTEIENLKGKSKKDREKSAKEFYKTYREINAVNKRLGWQKKGVPDYDTCAVGCAISKAEDSVYEAYGIYEDTQECAKEYVKTLRSSGDTDQQIRNRYIITTKTIEKGLQNAYKNDNSNVSRSMILANSNTSFADVAYYIKECDYKMNAARGLDSYGWKTNDVLKIKYTLGDSTKKADIVDAIESQDCTLEEKALLFEMLAPKNYRNPFGNVGDYSIKRDYGIGDDRDTSSAGGYNRSSRSGSSKSSSTDMPTWEDYIKDYLSSQKNSSSGSSGSSSTDMPSWEDYVKDYKSSIEEMSGVKFKSWDSPLDQAYRNKISKILKNMEA